MDNKYIITQRGKMIILDKEDILYIKAMNSSCLIKLADGQEYKQSKNLLYVIENLGMDDKFEKIHRSYLVNKSCIKGLYSVKSIPGQWSVMISSGEYLPVSKRYIRELKKRSFIR